MTRTGDISGLASVDYFVIGSGTNPADAADFGGTLPAGTVNFAASETTKTLTISISGDTLVEKSEGFRVTLANPSVGTVLATSVAAGLIQSDDASVSIAATNTTQAEGQSGPTAFTFTVTRTGDTSGSASVTFAVTGSGANPANLDDFGGTLPSGTVSFAVGATTQTLTIFVSGDTVVERGEGFRVTLSNPSLGTVVATAIAAGLIQNDDVAASISAAEAVFARLPSWIDSI